MNECITRDLMLLLDRFVSGRDTSLAAANQLEALLAESFPEDEAVQDYVDDLAQYRPGGGEFLFDEAEMCSRLGRLRHYLDGQ